MHPLGSEVVKACLPAGQCKPFRHNMMALMTVTGGRWAHAVHGAVAAVVRVG